MKWMQYYQRSAFSSLELHVIYEWWTMTPNMHHSLFPIHHFVHTSSITRKPWGACNSTTDQATSLLLRMVCSILKVAKQLQPTSYSTVQTLLSSYFVHKYKWQQNLEHLRLYYTSNNRFPNKVASFRSIKWTREKLFGKNFLLNVDVGMNMLGSTVVLPTCMSGWGGFKMASCT